MIDRAAYYLNLRRLAHQKRSDFQVQTNTFGLRVARGIYREEGIRIDTRKLTPGLKAIYMNAANDVSVAIRDGMPDEPKLFALVHELKHHWTDQEILRSGFLACGGYNENELIEKGAEVFAAEFIYPEEEFSEDARSMQVANWQVEDVIRFKREVSRAKKVSYMFITKRLERLRLTLPAQFQGVQFKKQEERLYGVPFYRQPWFRAARRRA
jgi:Zn-dependent peptidase ImmA (M78 family)